MGEKKTKVVNKIKHSINCGKTTPLGTKPNDECYTAPEDIFNELKQWGELGKFKNKRIICPCDWDITNDENDRDKDIYKIDIQFAEQGARVKRITCDVFHQETVIKDRELQEGEFATFLCTKVTCNFIRILVQNAKRWGIKSITASGFNPATGLGIKFQDVDYSQYDICITNPPFSLYGEFMKCIVGKIDFICLAPFLNRVTPNIGLPLMLRQAYLGFTIQTHFNFKNPTSENNFKIKKVCCDWITSFSEAQELRNKANTLKSINIKYEDYKDEYLVMENMTMKDGTHPIRVPAGMFPTDYKGWMFAGVNILDEISYDNYEWYGTNFKKYYNTEYPENNPFNHNASDLMIKTNGKQMFHGIVFRKKQEVK